MKEEEDDDIRSLKYNFDHVVPIYVEILYLPCFYLPIAC
jgi:hypothetical protein